ncbi:MAG: hypothetical protein AB8B71_13040 [Paracoccaceae bacterium]
MTTTKLFFETGALSTFFETGALSTLNLNLKAQSYGFSTGDDFVWNPERSTFNIIDIGLGPFGDLKVVGYSDFAFGFRFDASLGSPGTFETSYNIDVDVKYPDIVFDSPSENTVAFDFTDVTVTKATSQSTGISAPVQVDIPGKDDPLDLPAGLRLSMIVGAEFGIESISVPTLFSGTKNYDGFPIIPFAETDITLFQLDARNSTQSFKLGDGLSLKLRLPTGASTNGESTGSTIVSDKGYSAAPFVSLNGDLDKLLVKLIKSLPGVGTVVGTFLEKTLFVEVEEDLSDYIPFLDKEWLTFEVTLVDLGATAGLHITEEISVDIGYDETEDLPDFQALGGTNNVNDFFSGIFDPIEDPGKDKTPNVKVVLRSDQGTPDNLLDDTITTGFLGDVINVPDPINSAAPGEVTVDAWFDVESAKVSHSVGLGGKFSVSVSVLAAGIGGSIGEKLGISFGPLFYQELPPGGLKVDLVNFFTRRFDLEGGTFENLPTGSLNASNHDVTTWNYEAGHFNQQTAQYKYFWTNVKPFGFDPTAENARQIAIDFAIANAKWRQEVIETFKFVLDARDIQSQDHVFLNTGRQNVLQSENLSDTAVFWTDTSGTDSFAFLNAAQNNVVIAAPQFQPSVGAGLSFMYSALVNEGTFWITETLNTNSDIRKLTEYLDVTSSIAGQGIDEFSDAQMALELARYANDFSSNLGLNVLGTPQNDLIVYSEGANPNVGQPPEYLDGASEDDGINVYTSTGDVLLANFQSVHSGLGVQWDMLTEQLQEVSDGEMQFYQFQDATGANSISGTVLDFPASLLEFRDPDAAPGTAPEHQTAIRNFERFVIRFGDEADLVRTGINHYEYLELGGGDDRVVLNSDKVQDIVNAQAGDDVIILSRQDFVPDRRGIDPQATEAIQSLRVFFGSDAITGGTGFDMVTIATGSLDPALGSGGGLSDQATADASITAADLSKGYAWSTNSQHNDTFIDAGSNIHDLREGLEEILITLDPDAAMTISRDVSIDGFAVDEFFADENPAVILALAGEYTSGAYIFNDVEAINVEGSGAAADLAVFTGGIYYEGGTRLNGGSPADSQPVDVFLADFSAYETAKSRIVVVDGVEDTVAPGGINLIGADITDPLTGEIARGGIDWVDTSITGFEKWVVTGTSQSDRMVGGAWDDFLDGGEGDDQFQNSGSGDGIDFLIGGGGNDRFTVDMSVSGASYVYGDTFVDELPSELSGRLDQDSLNVFYSETTGSLFQVVTETGVLDITVDATLADADRALQSRADVRALGIVDSTLTNGVVAAGIEQTNVLGSDAFDEVLLYDGGTTYIGGERSGDKDLFIADFTGDLIPLEILIEDDPDTQPGDIAGATLLENGVFLAGIDRAIVTFGEGDDTFRGGRYNDIIDAGAGHDNLTGDGGSDTLNGGAGNDLFYWEGNDGTDVFDGGSGLDRLAVSNMTSTGDAFAQGGILQDVLNAEFGEIITLSGGFLTADSSHDDIAQVLSLVGTEGLNWGLSFVGATENVLTYRNMEALEIQGAHEFDDIIVYQGGLMYAGGEQAGDADVFAANFGGAFEDLTLSTLDAPAGSAPGTAFRDIGNGVMVGEFEKLHVITGFGDDTVTGGRLDDYIETGGGADQVVATLGNDVINTGAGEDRLAFIGGTQRLDGGADFDRIEIAAQELGYALATLDTFGVAVAAPIVADGVTSVSSYRTAIDEILNTEGGLAQVRLTHAGGTLEYRNIEFVSATGANAGDVFISGIQGGVLSTDGGDDILISDIGNDFLLGGPGRDAYVFGRNFGHDVIGNEFADATELHFVGTNLADLTASTDFTGEHLILTKDAFSSVTIFNYFATGPTPSHVTVFADDALAGTSINVAGLITNSPGAPLGGKQFFGTTQADFLDDFTDAADFYYGFAGDDQFLGNPGPDLFDGSLGVDFVNYQASTEGVGVFLGNATPGFGGLAAGDLFVSIEGVIGSNLNDNLAGSSAGNQLYGADGDDLVIGRAGDDALFGGAGADRLSGGAGHDLIFGGADNDTITGTFDSDLGNDTLIGGAGDDNLSDFEGNNQFSGGAGNDTATGGSGDDTYLYIGREDRFDGAYDTGIPREITGGFDVFEGNGGTDSIVLAEFGAAVQIFVEGFNGVNGYVETSETDTYVPFAPDARTLLSLRSVENAVGTDFNDVIGGSSANNRLEGGSGNDSLAGYDGDDTIIGGSGRDLVDYFGEEGSFGVFVNMAVTDFDDVTGDPLFGVASDSYRSSDVLNSIEDVVGTANADTIFGSDADNIISGMQGGDTLDGRGGIDTLDLSHEGGLSGVVVDVLYEIVTDSFGDQDSIVNFESYILTARNDLIYADIERIAEIDAGLGNDTIIGSLLGDQITGGGGNDSALMGAGDDTYFYTSGNDTVSGQAGFDVIDFSASTVQVSVDTFLQKVFRLFSGDVLVELADDIERFVGSDLDDYLFGDDGNDDLFGGAGNDRFGGNGGADTLDGGTGDDLINAGAGDDVLTGGEGFDTINGEAGNDTYFYIGENSPEVGFQGGTDQFDGGADTDTMSFEGFGDSVHIRNASGDVIDRFGNALVVFDQVEVVIGTESSDAFSQPGGGTVRHVQGLGGEDYFFGALNGIHFDGGRDQDALDYSNAQTGAGGIFADLEQGQIVKQIDTNAVDTVVNVEWIIGTDQQDIFLGDRNDNLFEGGAGADIYDGGTGSDTISFLREDIGVSNNGLIVDLSNTTSDNITDMFGNQERARNIENVKGSNYSDFIVGSDADNTLEGYDGNDELYGLDGNDLFYDGLGADLIDGGQGDDTLYHTGGTYEFDAGTGEDALFFSRLGSAVAVSIRADQNFALSNGTAQWSGEGVSDEIGTHSGVEDLIGSHYSDLLIGNVGVNLLAGLGGDDTLVGGNGDDELVGGDGLDQVNYYNDGGALGVVVSLGLKVASDTFGDTDLLSSIENVLGSDLADTIAGDEFGNVITGNAGVDRLDGDGGFDTLDYSAEFGVNGVVVYLGLGLAGDSHQDTDIISGFEAVIGTDQGDTLHGDDIGNLLMGGAGADVLWGRGGSDTLTGGTEADTFVHAPGDGTVIITDFETGVDVLDLSEHLRRRADVALDGIREINTGDLVIEIEGQGSVVLENVALADFDVSRVVLSDQALPVLEALPSGSTVTGNAEDESLQGQGGNDTLLAGDGDDVVDGGAGDDVLDGGAGRNKVSYAQTTGGGVTVNFLTGQALEPTGVDTLTNFSEAEGSEQADLFIGGNAGETFEGRAGDDTFRPGQGEDRVVTGAGEDTVAGTLSEINGDSVSDFEEGDVLKIEGMTLNGGQVMVSRGSAIFEIDGNGDGYAETRVVFEGDYDDAQFELTTTADGNSEIRIAADGTSELTQDAERFVTEDNGANQVYALGGDDFVASAGGADIIRGGLGADVLVAGTGDDRLIGGAGGDRLVGGTGADVFVFDRADFVSGTPTADFIADFEVGVDSIELSGFGVSNLSDFTVLPAGSGVALLVAPDALIVFEDIAISDLNPQDFVFTQSMAQSSLLSILSVNVLTDTPDRFITLDDGPNMVRAGAGGDAVIGGDGTNVLMGEAGPDVLLGGADADRLIGGPGGDRLTGRGGADSFEFTAGDETGFVADFITDYEAIDTLVFDGFGFDSRDDLPFTTLPNGNVGLQLGQTYFLVFEGITDQADISGQIDFI